MKNHHTENLKISQLRAFKFNCKQCKFGHEQNIVRMNHVNDIQKIECKYCGALFRMENISCQGKPLEAWSFY